VPLVTENAGTPNKTASGVSNFVFFQIVLSAGGKTPGRPGIRASTVLPSALDGNHCVV